MLQDWELVDEELIRSAAEKPAPSKKLRRRVLRAARQAARRQRNRRRILIAASFLLPAVALGSWYQQYFDRDEKGRSSLSATQEKHRRGPNGEIIPGSPADSDNAMRYSSPEEWDHVEASMKERRKRAKIIPSKMY